MSAPVTERWSPDEQLVAAVLAGGGRHQMAELPVADRCWLVAGLTLAGMTAEDIRDRLSCSLRLVRAIRAEPMTQLCLIYQREVENFANEMRLAVSSAAEHRRTVHEIVSERNKLKEQLDRVLDARLIGEQIDTCGQGHLLTPWNTYIHRGRRWCRECHAARQRDYRMAKRLGVPPAQIRAAREAGTLDDLIASRANTLFAAKVDSGILNVIRAASTSQVNATG